jgi:hypothetical protein
MWVLRVGFQLEGTIVMHRDYNVCRPTILHPGDSRTRQFKARLGKYRQLVVNDPVGF